MSAMQQQIEGNWREFVGKVKQQWASITDDDFLNAEGSLDQLIGVIQRKTGETREAIETTFTRWVDDAEHEEHDATEMAQQYADQAMELAQRKLAQASKVIKRHPAESVAISFGSGILAGLMFGMLTLRR